MMHLCNTSMPFTDIFFIIIIIIIIIYLLTRHIMQSHRRKYETLMSRTTKRRINWRLQLLLTNKIKTKWKHFVASRKKYLLTMAKWMSWTRSDERKNRMDPPLQLKLFTHCSYYSAILSIFLQDLDGVLILKFWTRCILMCWCWDFMREDCCVTQDVVKCSIWQADNPPTRGSTTNLLME